MENAGYSDELVLNLLTLLGEACVALNASVQTKLTRLAEDHSPPACQARQSHMGALGLVDRIRGSVDPLRFGDLPARILYAASGLGPRLNMGLLNRRAAKKRMESPPFTVTKAWVDGVYHELQQVFRYLDGARNMENISGPVIRHAVEMGFRRKGVPGLGVALADWSRPQTPASSPLTKMTGLHIARLT